MEENMDYLIKAKTILTNINIRLNDIKHSYLEFMKLIKDFNSNETDKSLEELEEDYEYNYLKMLIKDTEDKITNNNIQINHFNEIIGNICNKLFSEF